MTQKKLMIVYAHPDDESFGSGGLIAKYVAQGAHVDYVCATDGDMGTPDEAIANETSPLAEIRLKELACSQQVLGIRDVIRLEYLDSGMLGDDSNNAENCLWYQWQNNADAVVDKLVKIFRDVQPQVVVTFNRYGGYGHPDHIAIQAATTQAFNRIHAEASGTAYTPQKLYYASIPAEKFYSIYLMLLRLQGKDVRHMGLNRDIDLQAVKDHLEPIHTVVDVRDYMDVWDEASDCHISQGQGRNTGTRGMLATLPAWIRQRMAGYDRFTRVYPKPSHDHIDEYDLFSGVVIDN
jgi:LmbE family N-acetylglucosaminyl deacetylase